MEERIYRIDVPVTETGFYILFCLQSPQYGTGIGRQAEEMTEKEVSISPGTLYGTLSKREKDGLISVCMEKEKRNLCRITSPGREIPGLELSRMERLYRNSKGESQNA